jgi:hypothetical protein
VGQGLGLVEDQRGVGTIVQDFKEGFARGFQDLAEAVE